MNYKVMLAKILSEKELADMDIKNKIGRAHV